MRFASGADGWSVQDVTAASAVVTAPNVLNDVMAGDSLVVTAPATLPGKVKSVKAVKYASVESITLDATATVEVGSTKTLTASVLPAAANNKNLTWSSDNTAYATVDQNGVVTGVAVGTANITATATDGSGVTATCAVTVRLPLTLSDVTINHIGYLVTTEGHLYPTQADVTAAGKTAVAMVAYVGNQSDCTHGLAIALANESGSMTMSAGETACSNKNTSNPVAGGTWRLPSNKDWQSMLFGCGTEGSYVECPDNTEFNYSGLASYLSAAQGTALYTGSVWYWTATPICDYEGEAYNVFFTSSSELTLGQDGYNTNYKVRAVLAF